MSDYDFNQFKQDFMDGVSNVADAVSSAAKDTGTDVARIKHFNETGRDLSRSGATTSHGGNLSVCDGESIWITRTNAMLGHLTPNDILKVFMSPTDLDNNASMELVVHRAMYQACQKHCRDFGMSFGIRAIVHAHTKFTVLRSLIDASIRPVDSEGKLILGESVEILTPEKTVASEEAASQMAGVIYAGASLGVIRGHGPFALADSLENAYRLISCLEYSCEIITLLGMAKNPADEPALKQDA